MRKGSKHTEEARRKLARTWFKAGKVPHNKGVHNPKYEESAAKRFRREKSYYLKELELNARRRSKQGYDEKRAEEIAERNAYYHRITGVGRPAKNWSEEDVEWLRENYKKPRLEICAYLTRSWASVQHKVSRLGLLKHHKWT